MAGWTVEIKKSGVFSSRSHFDVGFDLPLNQPGTFHATIVAGAAAPERGDEVKIWWDKGGSQERLWVRGVATTVREIPQLKVYEISGYDDSIAALQSSLGDRRDYGFVSPYTIAQSSGTPKGLLYNAQGSTIATYGTTAPNAITSASPGLSLTFRAHKGRTLLNIARLCEQATYDDGGVTKYGLEWFFSRDASDNLVFNLVTRRQRAASYTAETFRIGVDLFAAPKENYHDTDYNRVKVIGEGSGTEQIESPWVGTGSREFVFTDKNVSNTTTAENLARRILAAVNQGATGRYEARTHKHDFDTDVGDDVVIQSVDGLTSSLLRVFGIKYEMKQRAFTFEVGRARGFFTSYLRDAQRMEDAVAVHTQKTDLKPLQTQPSPAAASGPAGATAVADNGYQSLVSVTALAAHANSDGWWLKILVSVSADVPGHLLWDVQLDGTVYYSFTTTGLKAGKTFKHYAFIPWGSAAATTWELYLENKSGGSVTVPLNGCTLEVSDKPRFRMNA